MYSINWLSEYLNPLRIHQKNGLSLILVNAELFFEIKNQVWGSSKKMIKEQRLSQNLPRMDWLTFSVFKDQANFLMPLMILPILMYEKYIYNN